MTSPATLTVDLEPDRLMVAEMFASVAGLDGPEARRAASLSDSARGIDTGSPDAEDRLVKHEARLRSMLLARGHRAETAVTRSRPLQRRAGALVPAPRSHPAAAAVGYERSMPSPILEARESAAVKADRPDAWTSTPIFVSSGMSASTLALLATSNLVRSGSSTPVRGILLGDYFETRLLLRFLSGADISWAAVGSADEMDSIYPHESPAVLFVEPVRYGWDLAPVNMIRLAARLAEHKRPAAVLIVDSTLTSPGWGRESLLAALSEQPTAPVVVEVRSGLKLDQQGLEIANAGVLTVHYMPGSAHADLARSLADTARLMRGTMGFALGCSAQRALEAPFLFDKRWTRIHGAQVFDNNRRLARQLNAVNTGVRFANIVHPSLSGPGHAPFVILRVPQDDPHQAQAIKDRLLRELAADLTAGRTNLGSSFGFRGPRFETITPSGMEQRMFVKVAIGSRAGPAAQRLAECLTAMASQSC